jgi:hypothetical protein
MPAAAPTSHSRSPPPRRRLVSKCRVSRPFTTRPGVPCSSSRVSSSARRRDAVRRVAPARLVSRSARRSACTSRTTPRSSAGPSTRTIPGLPTASCMTSSGVARCRCRSRQARRIAASVARVASATSTGKPVTTVAIPSEPANRGPPRRSRTSVAFTARAQSRPRGHHSRGGPGRSETRMLDTVQSICAKPTGVWPCSSRCGQHERLGTAGLRTGVRSNVGIRHRGRLAGFEQEIPDDYSPAVPPTCILAAAPRPRSRPPE